MKDSGKFILGIVATLIVLGAAGGTYYYSKTQQKGTQIFVTPTPTNTQEVISTPTSIPITEPQKKNNKSMVIENIEASVKSKNYAALEGYMANEVSVILYATECCGILSAQKATEQMSYLNNGTPPWDFSTSNSIAQKLIAADPANFAGRIIGLASNGMVVSFSLNSENKIGKIFISVDHKLVAP